MTSAYDRLRRLGYRGTVALLLKNSPFQHGFMRQYQTLFELKGMKVCGTDDPTEVDRLAREMHAVPQPSD